MGAFTEQDDVGHWPRGVASRSRVALAATGRRGRAAGQLEGGEGSGDRPDALQEPPAVDAEPPRATRRWSVGPIR